MWYSRALKYSIRDLLNEQEVPRLYSFKSTLENCEKWLENIKNFKETFQKVENENHLIVISDEFQDRKEDILGIISNIPSYEKLFQECKERYEKENEIYQEKERIRLEKQELHYAKLREERKMKEQKFKEIRQAEVTRCKEVNSTRHDSYYKQSSLTVYKGICTNNRCRNYDYCTYLHFGSRHAPRDLPPRCMYFAEKECTLGDLCPFNHLPSELHPDRI